MPSLPPPLQAGTDAIGVIGVGNMGGAMARRLLDQHWQVLVHDIDATRMDALAAHGAVACADAATLAQGCRCVIVAVVDATQCDDVLLGPRGVLAARPLPHSVLLCPTIGPQDTERLAQALHTQGVACLDAPMSGGPARARDGSMSLMLAGDEAVLARHAALLQALSSRIFSVGPRVGDAARTKLVNNLLAGINLAGAAEALALAGALGLDLARTLDVIEQSSGQSWIGSDRLRRAIAGDYAPRAHTTLLAKDTRLALQAAEAVGFTPTLGPVAAQAFAQACAEGLAELDDASLFKRLQTR